jgi:hypothetical protein
MTIRTSHFLVFLSVALLGATAAGCDDGAGTGGAGTTSSGTMTGTTGSMSTGSMGTGSSTSTASSMSTGTGVSMSEWEMYCDARAALNCSASFNAATCKSQEACATGLLKDSIEASLLDCLKTECSGDKCLGATINSPISAEGMKFQTGCMQYLNDCPMAGDDVCGSPYYVADSGLAELNKCLESGDCTAKADCLSAFGDKIDMCEDWL